MRWSGVAIALGFAFSCSLPTLAGSVDAPPPDLAPTSEHLATILINHEAALGKPTAGLPDTVIEDWRYTDSGISGKEHLERSGDNYHSRITAGPLVEEFGQFDGKRWHRDYNGSVSPTTQLDDRTFYADYVNEDAADPKNDATVIGITTGDHPAYVVQVKVSGSLHPEWIFYDASTFLITRVERIIGGHHRIVTTFDDFRTTDGVTSPWHMHDAWDPREFDDDYVRTSMQVGVPVDSTQFAQPPSASQLPSYSTIGMRLPAKIYNDGTIVLRMNVAGRGLDLMLDTLTSEDILDEDVATQLNLPTYGHVTRLPNGDYASFYTTIPLATIGASTYKNVVFHAMPYNFQQSWDTKVVGVLGYDFLANNVVEISYDNGGSVTIMPSVAFNAATPVAGGITYPIDFDDGVPFISMPIGDDMSNNVVLTIEFTYSILFGSYIASHTPIAPSDKATTSQADLPFADSDSFGHVISIFPVQPSHISFGSVNFQQPEVVGTDYPLRFSDDRPVDAALGFDFLRWFDVYLDYPHDRIIVKPNQFFFHVTHEHAHV